MAKKNCGCGQDPCVTFGAEKWEPMPPCEECGAVEGGNIDGCDDCNFTYWFNGKVYHPDSIIHIGAETFEAPYAGSGSLFSVGSSDSLSGLSSQELTESSAIHGDFDSASLNYSGHQNLQVRAETFEAENVFIFSDDYINYGKAKMYEEDENEVRKMFLETVKKRYPHISDDKITISLEMFDSGKWRGEAFIDATHSEMNAETFESMSWYDPGEDTNNLERAFRREYPRYTLDSGSMEYLIYQGGASNKFHIFFVAQDDGGQYHAFNAYGRIGYNPRIQYIGGPYSTKASAEYAFGKKMGQKTKKGYRPFGAEGYGSISAYTTIPYSWETDSDYDDYIDEYDINQSIEYEVDQEVRSGNRSGSSTYTTTVGYDDPNDEDSYIQEDLDVDYSWGAEGSEDIPQVELHNPIETGIKLSLGSMIAVVGISALGGAMLGLLNRTMGDE
jgi:predicted DNA-binding WGR domain protein